MSTVSIYTAILQRQKNGSTSQVLSDNPYQAQVNAFDIQADYIAKGQSLADAGIGNLISGYTKSQNDINQQFMFNQRIADTNLKRAIEATSAEYTRAISTQKAQIAASGISVSSRSALLLQNEANAAKERELLQLSQDAMDARRAAEFSRDVSLSNIEQQKTAAKIEGEQQKRTTSKQLDEVTLQKARVKVKGGLTLTDKELSLYNSLVRGY